MVIAVALICTNVSAYVSDTNDLTYSLMKSSPVSTHMLIQSGPSKIKISERGSNLNVW